MDPSGQSCLFAGVAGPKLATIMSSFDHKGIFPKNAADYYG
jgi:hypothetical protein